MSESDYQVVTLTLGDGRKCSYTGRAQMDAFSRIVSVEVTPPRTLPSGMSWDTIPTGEEGLIDEGDA